MTAAHPVLFGLLCMAGTAWCLDVESYLGSTWTVMVSGVLFLLVAFVCFVSAAIGWPIL